MFAQQLVATHDDDKRIQGSQPPGKPGICQTWRKPGKNLHLENLLT